MNNCTQCGTSAKSSDKFCGGCGHHIGGDDADGQALFSKLMKNVRWRNFGVLVAAVVLLVVAWVYVQGTGKLVATVFLFIVYVNYGRSTYMSQSEYYSIPGSTDDRGEHLCVHCGNRGIFRKGKYKTNNSYANCSKCQGRLFSC